MLPFINRLLLFWNRL